jgi:hypothetical protein
MKPTTNEEHIGIEIECIGMISLRDLREVLYSDPYLAGNVHVGYDLSIKVGSGRGDYNQHEVRLLCTNATRKMMVDRTMEHLNNQGCIVNDSCSIHVHLDMRQKSSLRMRTIFYNLVKCCEFLFTIQKEHRRESIYCARNTYETFSGTVENETGENDRRRAINAHCYNTLRTLEVRMHHGTLDAEEVNTFIDLILKIKNKVRRLSDEVNTIEDLKRLVTKDRSLLSSLRDRLERYDGVA